MCYVDFYVLDPYQLFGPLSSRLSSTGAFVSLTSSQASTRHSDESCHFVANWTIVSVANINQIPLNLFILEVRLQLFTVHTPPYRRCACSFKSWMAQIIIELIVLLTRFMSEIKLCTRWVLIPRREIPPCSPAMSLPCHCATVERLHCCPATMSQLERPRTMCRASSGVKSVTESLSQNRCEMPAKNKTNRYQKNCLWPVSS